MRLPCTTAALATVSALVTALGAGEGRAETLQDAMALALRHYPPILAEQARMHAARFGIDVARAGGHPRVTASGDVGAANSGLGLAAGSGSSSLGSAGSPFGTDWAARWGYSLVAEQPLFDGFRTRSAVAEAEAGSEAARAQVRLAEQIALVEAATVYADLMRDRDVEALRARDAAMLAEQVRSATARVTRGDATATDVAQTRARHAQALAELITARASVAARTAEYVRVIGREPGPLVRPELPEHLLPRSLDAVVAGANAGHPMAAVAAFKEEASRHSIDRMRADGLPQVKLRGGVEGDHPMSSAMAARDGASVAVRVTVPLYDGGESAARVQQAVYVNRSLAAEARGIRERLLAGAQTAWTGLAAARERIAAERVALAEMQRALAGIGEEVRLGQRSLLDQLDTHREMVNVEVRVAGSERDLLVAAYTLLSATGASPAAVAIAGGEPRMREARGTAKASGRKAAARPPGQAGWGVKNVERVGQAEHRRAQTSAIVLRGP